MATSSIFDIGSGSHERIAAQKIPYDYLDKVFIGHLHVDHFGDLPPFWLGGTSDESAGSASGLGTQADPRPNSAPSTAWRRCRRCTNGTLERAVPE